MLYQLYAAGRDALGLKFKNHRTHAAFATLREKGVNAAWQQAVRDNAMAGNSNLPAQLKAFLEVIGVVFLALFGLKRWLFVAAAAVWLFPLTASEFGNGGGGDRDRYNYSDFSSELKDARERSSWDKIHSQRPDDDDDDDDENPRAIRRFLNYETIDDAINAARLEGVDEDTFLAQMMEGTGADSYQGLSNMYGAQDSNLASDRDSSWEDE